MNALNSSINKYQETLLGLQEAIDHYITSIGELSQSIELIENESVKNRCEELLSLSIIKVVEIQHITKQKEHLLKSWQHD